MKAEGAVWRALADPSRRALLDHLRDGPRTTGQLAGAFPDVTRFAVMKHLAVLEDAGLVVARKRGRERWNHLNAVPLRQAYERWMAPYAEAGAEVLLRLKDHVEGTTMSTAVSLPMGSLDVAYEVTVEAPREKVWAAVVRIGEWWPHRFRDGAAVVLEPYVGGRFFEDWGDGGGAQYGVVARLDAPSHLAVSGPMGIHGPVAGVWTMELEAVGDSTVLRGTHRAFGDIDAAAQESYSSGWGEVVAALKASIGV